MICMKVSHHRIFQTDDLYHKLHVHAMSKIERSNTVTLHSHVHRHEYEH